MADEQPNTPARAGRNQRASSSAQGQHKRNNRNRKTANNHVTDGTVSDGALANPTMSPQAHRASQSVAMGASRGQQNLGVGQASAQRSRPVSVGGGNMISYTPVAEQAYAGPTFQASPAASALPVPKFFSKSVPNISGQPSLQGRLAGEKTPEEQISSPEADRVSPVPLRQTQSPLDLFFKADRAERERTQSSGFSHSPGPSAGTHPATAPRNMFQQSSRRDLLRELDGDDIDLPSPRTVPSKSRPPFAERSHSSPGVPVQPTSDAGRQACTESLKNLLFDTSAVSPTTAGRRKDSHSFTPGAEAASSGSSPFQQHTPSGPNTPQGQTYPNTNYHYGNRNLSPLFKAARETPPRPSSLRQEMAPNVGMAYMPRPQSRETNNNMCARSYLDEQIRNSAPAEMPQFRSANKGPLGSGAAPGSRHTQQGGPNTTPRTGGPRDILTMEDDLRRMLKLNV